MRWMGSKRRCRSTGPPRPERVRAAQGCFAAGERIRLYKLMRDLSLNDMVFWPGGRGGSCWRPPHQPGWGEGRPARRSGRSRRTAHGPAPVPARRGRRPCRDCAAGVVALSGGTAAGAHAPSNRIRQQLWRYYPQLLAVSDDVTAEWVLDLWTLAPTPTQAARLREATLARLLQERRIRRLDAERVLGILRQPAITVANGVTEAAVLH